MMVTVYFADGQYVTGELRSWDEDSADIDGFTYIDWVFMDLPSSAEMTELGAD